MQTGKKLRIKGVEGKATVGKSGTGTPQIVVPVTIVGDASGAQANWIGFLNDENFNRTLEAMKLMGWTGKDFDDLKGLGRNIVRGDVELNDYNGNTSYRCNWISEDKAWDGFKEEEIAEKPAFMADLNARLKGGVVTPPKKEKAPETATGPASEPDF